MSTGRVRHYLLLQPGSFPSLICCAWHPAKRGTVSDVCFHCFAFENTAWQTTVVRSSLVLKLLVFLEEPKAYVGHIADFLLYVVAFIFSIGYQTNQFVSLIVRFVIEFSFL